MTEPVQGNRRLELRVPASIANLGPGFDTLAVAVQLYLQLCVEVVDDHRGAVSFDFGDTILRGENYIDRAYRFLARQAGHAMPSLKVNVHSEIPMCSGLGSSAAATVAGIRLYDAIAGPLTSNEMLNAATAIEGHPDNVAAAIFGGLTSTCELPDGSCVAVRHRWPESLKMLVLTPEYELGTSVARKVLPTHYERRDAIHNIQRMVLLLNALQTEDYSLLREALQDRFHQPYRMKLVPGLHEILELEHPDMLGACLSGAGPSIVAFAERNAEDVAQLMKKTYAGTGIKCTVRLLAAHQEQVRTIATVQG